MGQDEDKSMNIAGCGCLLGLLIGFILVVAMVFSGSMIRNLKGILILIPLLGLFCGSVPMMVLSPDKGLRVGAGCICYPLLIYMILAVSLDRGRIAWGWIAFLGVLVLAGIIAGAVRKYRSRQ
ncbi:hypothetical protein HF882_17415 [Victivallis vadensis]|uniref:Uncharacterized protein n=1 Tax=Victivallis vadensis TaxID=172901 RepID=A0A848AYP5_9BACT|nr:hypothetical protein [Victivallis vadensis]AVM44057.1 hypothetical protein C5Q97_04755 [Victivallales bacterium CCUG 44730]NMD88368.1 hypothetical protein [Victivallis vadensis]